MASGPYIIYALVDPRSGQWRYIGKTETSLEKRLREHWCNAGSKRADGSFKMRQHVYCWIRSMGGRKPEILLVEECAGHDELVAAEMAWIAEARRLGIDLTNGTDGGEGAFGYRHSPETLRKIAETRKKRLTPWPSTGPKSLETKLQISRTKTGLTRSQQEAIVAEYLAGDSCNVVGARYEVGQKAVLGLVRAFGHEVRTQSETTRVIKPAMQDEVARLYRSGKSLSQIALTFGVASTPISATLERMGIARRPPSLDAANLAKQEKRAA